MAKLFEGKTVVDSVLESKFEIISEKARLLYVGITRAKEYLFLSSYEQNKGKRGELPSRYFLELRRYIEEAGKV
ncbi:3'-5' exonuclease [Acetivibrio straminisolvens]|uniref:ATP-dependent DNA helicase UvrD/PcrA/Rep n=2 Tax=Acetivibrio straminisolvens TaxID=253314 RepID=W4V2H2_9FIRM|nr:3'-5' exonuclease [Acetivibrio straminisolvens]GAE87013.1 ATP-dependent DNA helicase UvrD/PcrA/Rep [Acetivibrio straminisolvens JCM 21531]